MKCFRLMQCFASLADGGCNEQPSKPTVWMQRGSEPWGQNQCRECCSDADAAEEQSVQGTVGSSVIQLRSVQCMLQCLNYKVCPAKCAEFSGRALEATARQEAIMRRLALILYHQPTQRRQQPTPKSFSPSQSTTCQSHNSFDLKILHSA